MTIRREKEGVKPTKKRVVEAKKRAIKAILIRGKLRRLWRLPIPIAKRVKMPDWRRKTIPKSCGASENWVENQVTKGGRVWTEMA
jgi:hypothetical protein